MKLKTNEQIEAQRLLTHILISLETVNRTFFESKNNLAFTKNYSCYCMTREVKSEQAIAFEKQSQQSRSSKRFPQRSSKRFPRSRKAINLQRRKKL